MRIGYLSTVAIAALSLAAADAALAGSKKKKKGARAPSNAELMQRIEALEDTIRELRGSQTPAPAPARVAPRPSAPPQAASAPAASVPAAAPAAPAPRAPGLVTFDPAAAERALERALVSNGATLLRQWQIELEPFLAYVANQTDFPRLVIPPLPAAPFIEEVKDDFSVFVAGLSARIGLPWNLQLEANVPYIIQDASREISVNGVQVSKTSNTIDSFGDISLALAATLLRGASDLPDVIGRIIWDTDTGSNGLGSGFNEVGAEFVAVKRQDPLVFILRGGYTHPFEKNNVEPGDTYSLGLETYLAVSPKTSLKLGVGYAYQDATKIGPLEIPGSEESRASLLFGGNTVVAQGVVLNINGTAGLTEDAPDFTISAGVSFLLN
jgi:hypothetical protein